MVTKDTMSEELGMRADVKLRNGVRARFTQACQKCGRLIYVGDLVDQYAEGWCHAGYRFRNVGR